MPLDDHELHDRFAALRRDDAARTPDFASLLRRPAQPRPQGRRRLAIAAAVVVAVSVGLFMFYPWRPAANASITEWRSPTDFLLQTPGHELLEGVPRIGQWPDEFLRSRPTATPSGKKKS